VGINPLNDEEAWTRAFADETEPIIKMPGAAGVFFNSALARDSLIAIQAPEKRGKTWWCIEFVWKALRQRRKVAFFQVGDLSEGQLLRRLAVRASGRPMYERDCGPILVPEKLVLAKDSDGKNHFEVEGETRQFRKPITRQSAIKAIEKFHRRCATSEDSTQLMVSVHPTNSASVRDIDSILTGWAVERDFVPDVIVVDYADILAPQSPRAEARDQINETWAALRRMSQEWHALVIVPTQANAASYSGKTQTMANFSNDKRKMAHVTGMLGLNQDEREKGEGIMRLNWIVLRESQFTTSACLYVGQCLTLGRALCGKTWMMDGKKD